MNMSKFRDIQAKMPSPKVFLSFKCILARNCEGTEQLQSKTDSTQTGYFLRNSQFESNLFFL